MGDMRFNFVSEDEARDFVYEYLTRLVSLFEEGAVTFMDLYYRIMAEPILTDNEKREIIRSPTRLTIFKLWKGAEPKYRINNVDVPANAVVVVEAKDVMFNLIRKYSFLKPIVRKPMPLGVMTSLKAISSIVKGFRAPIVIPDLPWKHMDALTTIAVMTRLANIQLITNVPVVLNEEREFTEAYNPRIASLGTSEDVIVVDVSMVSRRFQPALKKFIEDYGLHERAEALGIKVEELEWRDDWWNYLGLTTEVNEELFREALAIGLPVNVAKKIASWKVNSINDVIKLAREVRLLISDDVYFSKAIEFLASKFNLRPDVLLQLMEVGL